MREPKAVPMLMPRPMAINGALLGGVGSGLVLGPLAAVVGFVVGGLLGELWDRRLYPSRAAAGED